MACSVALASAFHADALEMDKECRFQKDIKGMLKAMGRAGSGKRGVRPLFRPAKINNDSCPNFRYRVDVGLGNLMKR